MNVQTLSPSVPSHTALCYYANTSDRLQMVRLVGMHEATSIWQSERIVFPRQRILFEASLQDELEVQTCDPDGVPNFERIPCDRLTCC